MADVRHGYDASGSVATVHVDGGITVTSRHAHASLVLGLVMAGERTLRGPDEALDLVAGDGFVIPPETAHAWMAGGDGEHRVIAIDVTPFAIPGWRLGRVRLASDWTGAFGDLFDAARAGSADVRTRVHRLLRLTDALVERADDSGRPLPATLQSARRYLEEDLGDALGLGQLARRVGLSPFHLHRLYSAAWGLTPAESRLENRIRQARRLIRSGERIADVAAELGFFDQSHFNRAFRKLMSVSPGVWAKQVGR